jgi:hypothetical protein
MLRVPQYARRIGLSVFWFGLLSEWGLYVFFAHHRPLSADPQHGRIYPLQIHGGFVYLTYADRSIGLFPLALVVGAMLFGMLMEYLPPYREKEMQDETSPRPD